MANKEETEAIRPDINILNDDDAVLTVPSPGDGTEFWVTMK
jgi:hypothetical protein